MQMNVTCSEAQAREIQATWSIMDWHGRSAPEGSAPGRSAEIFEYADIEYSNSHYLPRAVTALAMVSELDHETRAHSERVASAAWCFGRRLRLGGEELQRLHYAALLHDIGKLAVKPAILNKTTGLTAQETVTMRRHAHLGAARIAGISAISDLARSVRHHHESFDGTGYPHGLHGYDIPLFARIIAILDSYDAMVSDRCYRAGYKPDRALRIIKACSGVQFDPTLVDAFLAMH
jgi:putative two-component system response regulator